MGPSVTSAVDTCTSAGRHETGSDRADGNEQDEERQTKPKRASHDRYYDPHA
jgi:hypothetical protein